MRRSSTARRNAHFRMVASLHGEKILRRIEGGKSACALPNLQSRNAAAIDDNVVAIAAVRNETTTYIPL